MWGERLVLFISGLIIDASYGGQLGSWVISAAKEWPEYRICAFISYSRLNMIGEPDFKVGFDLVNVQISLDVLRDPSIANRITWMHGNL